MPLPRLSVIILTLIKLDFSLGITFNSYMGENFPENYLEPEDYRPTKKDLKMYLSAMSKTVDYFLSQPNQSDVNRAMSLFLARGILKKTLQEDSNKLSKKQYSLVNILMQCMDMIVSHFIYSCRDNSHNAISYKVAQLMRNEDLYTLSIEDFHKNKLKKWISSNAKMNNFLQQIDAASLSRETYAELVANSSMGNDYYITIESSDRCLSHVFHNLEPTVGNKQLRKCNRDAFCQKHIHGTPAVAYSLSHKFFNILLYRSLRHCYFKSADDDARYMEALCAFMYREAVYIARRGFFARDIFLEHVGLCAQMGHQEFYRRHWFRKVVSWTDEDGCEKENRNFEIYLNKVYIQKYKDDKATVKNLKKQYRLSAVQDCQEHPMGLSVLVLANAVRHAAHFLPKVFVL